MVLKTFAEKLAIGGRKNSLGIASEVVEKVLQDRTHLNELYDCLFVTDPWIRMRAADSLEKVCRIHPEWLETYTDRLLSEVARSSQPSLRWHLAQMLREIKLTSSQKEQAIQWLEKSLEDENVDWIVAANTMTTLLQFTKDGSVPKEITVKLIVKQQKHHSQSVRKRATKILIELEK